MPAAQHAHRQAFRTRRRDPHLKRDAVLGTAVKLFLDVGYHRATLDEVARRLNITKPALYNYFESKEDILSEAYRRGLMQVEAQLAGLESKATNGFEQLHAIVKSYASVMLTDLGKCLVIVDPRELTAGGARARVMAVKRDVDHRFRTCITRGIDDGSIRDCDPKLMALLIGSGVNSVARWFNEDGGEWTTAGMVDQLTGYLLADLRPVPTKKSKSR